MDTNNQVVPPEINRFNWGAFFFSWVWAIRHGVWIGLLGLVPFLGLIMRIVLGFRGNVWAWQRNLYASSADFLKTQRRWGQVGLVCACLAIFGILSIFGLSFSALRHNSADFKSAAIQIMQEITDETVQTAFIEVSKNKKVQKHFGQPLKLLNSSEQESSYNIEDDGVTIEAIFKVKGPKKTGYIAVEMRNNDLDRDEWEITKLEIFSNLKKIK